jgi:serine/threonine protein kinase
VAIKIINLFDKDKRHQFYNELDMIQSFCPVLVRYYGCLFDEGEIHLVMEYMDCGSLETMIAVEKQFRKSPSQPLIPELSIARFACHVLQGMNHLHAELKQIHRDVKPDNILVESILGLAKLSDFGISKQLKDSQAFANEHTRTFTGTLCYMSPERLQSLDYSYPSDIWSLGVVVYEMATGEHPFPKTNRPIEIHNFIKNSAPPSLVGSPLVSIECADFIARW